MNEGEKIPAVLLQNQEGVPITNVAEWLRYAPPKKGKDHWRPGRSAAELAYSWFRTSTAVVPEELMALFNSHPETQGLIVEQAIAEKKTNLDNFKGETRNNDLILIGRAGPSVIVVGIEGKVDEPFDDPIGKHEMKARQKNPRSKVPDRISMLLDAVFADQPKEELKGLRYQLLHAFAATLIEAKHRNATLAVFVVHEFITDEADQKKLETNREDLISFIHTFPELRDQPLRPGALLGPVRIRGGEFIPKNIPAYMGKVETVLRKNA